MLSALGSFILSLAFGFWLSSDATTCGRNPVKWFFVGFIFGFIAVAVYYWRKDLYQK